MRTRHAIYYRLLLFELTGIQCSLASLKLKSKSQTLSLKSQCDLIPNSSLPEAVSLSILLDSSSLQAKSFSSHLDLSLDMFTDMFLIWCYMCVGERSSKELKNFLWDMVSPMILLNLLLVIPPEDPLGDDAIVQPVLEVIEVFVLVFALEPSEVVIDASLSHRGMLIEAIEDMVPNWDLDCGLEEMQLAALTHCLDTWRIYLLDRMFVARTCVLHTHMYCTGNIRDEFGIYLSVLDEFNFELVYMTTRLRDFVEQVDGAQSDSFNSDSSDSDLSESESEEEPWVSLAIDNILRT